jgi:DNA-binding response OmpR family regulator
MKILLVDDEKQFVKFLSKRLALRGKDADYAYTGEDAVKKVETTQYDVAILDVKMPGIGGIELKRKLSRLAPDMKIVFLTGHGSENDFKVGTAEAVHYLAKPVQIEELEKILNEIAK